MKTSGLLLSVSLPFLAMVAQAAEQDVIKIIAVQQAQINNMQKMIVALQATLDSLSSKITNEYTTTASLQNNYAQKNLFVSKDEFLSLLESKAGISCSENLCEVKRFLTIVPPGLSRSIHIPEGWGGNQPYVYCDNNGCYALLKW